MFCNITEKITKILVSHMEENNTNYSQGWPFIFHSIYNLCSVCEQTHMGQIIRKYHRKMKEREWKMGIRNKGWGGKRDEDAVEDEILADHGHWSFYKWP